MDSLESSLVLPGRPRGVCTLLHAGSSTLSLPAVRAAEGLAAGREPLQAPGSEGPSWLSCPQTPVRAREAVTPGFQTGTSDGPLGACPGRRQPLWDIPS